MRKEVIFGEVLDAVMSRLDNRERFAWKLDEGETVDGVLLGVGFYTSPLIFLRDGDGVFALNGHKNLIEQLRPLAIGTHVVITLTSKKSTGFGYEVRPTQEEVL